MVFGENLIFALLAHLSRSQRWCLWENLIFALLAHLSRIASAHRPSIYSHFYNSKATHSILIKFIFLTRVAIETESSHRRFMGKTWSGGS